MSTYRFAIAAALMTTAGAAAAEGPGLGTPLTDDEIPSYARYIMPDGRGLPAGSGTAAQGVRIYEAKCTTCHGATGVEGPIMPPVGPNDVWAKPAGKHWPYATTIFAYIRRAMPLTAPKSLSDDDAYALTAFILARNGVIKDDMVVSAESLPGIEMPNRKNFIDVWAKQGATPW